MAMLIAWQVLNKVTYPQDTRFSKHIFVVAPGLTVKSRLQVLVPAGTGQLLRRIQHRAAGAAGQAAPGQGARPQLAHAELGDRTSRSPRKKSVDKRGAKSDEAYVREVLGRDGQQRATSSSSTTKRTMPGACRRSRRSRASRRKTSRKRRSGSAGWTASTRRAGSSTATTSRRRRSRRPARRAPRKRCSAGSSATSGSTTPSSPGLVKTPRVVVRDDGMPDAKTYKSKLYHIYRACQRRPQSQSRRARAAARPGHQRLLSARQGLAGSGEGMEGARAPHAARHDHRGEPHRNGGARQIRLRPQEDPASMNSAIPERTLHIDSKVLEMAEAAGRSRWRSTATTEREDEDGRRRAGAES